MAEIDITITATLRAEILERTLASFMEKAFHNQSYRLIVNVDNTGTDEGTGPVEKVLENYWTKDSVLNKPPVPHFGRAFHWVWGQVTSPYVFHLEDDWELLRPIDVDAMIFLLLYNPSLALLRLPWEKTLKDQYRPWGCPFMWNGSYFVCPPRSRGLHGFCGHPTLIKKEFVKLVHSLLDPNKNPEKQIKGINPEMKRVLERFDFGVYGALESPPLIQDIGRAWRNEKQIVKAGHEPVFTNWKVNNVPSGRLAKT